MYRCPPICLKQYDTSSFDKCECGFEDYNAYDHEDELIFKIFKYTKNVFLNRIKYLYVHKDNPFYISDNNKLINK